VESSSVKKKSSKSTLRVRTRAKTAARPRRRDEPPISRAEEALAKSSEEERPQIKIAGIGASAGGLDAFRELLQAMPEKPGLALVLVQHLAASYESILPEILAGIARLPVHQVTEAMPIEADHVYVIPPNAEMEVAHGRFHLSPRAHGVLHMPIDYFFRSLARHAQGGAIGVVLSGTSSDGAIGVREIKAVGGIVIAQEPASARHDGMPRAAIATGVVDLTMEPREIAAELVRIAEHPLNRHIVPRRDGDELSVDDADLAQVYKILRNATGVDFTHYKTPTIKRRLQRRMVLHKLIKLSEYLKLLGEDPDEVRKLYQDLLIHVTRFFRDGESFDMLSERVFPRLVEDRAPDNPIRVWVAGCSTGEEAYSIAISLLEFLSQRSPRLTLQIFATDLSEPAVEHARTGFYPENIEADVSPERLRRFFTKIDGGYRISQAVRELCVFARQDITRDPPFSKLDLIVCRNVLIYLGTGLQKRLMSVFHYALKSTGFLLLGEVETIGASVELFSIAEKKHKLYTKKLVELPNRLDFALRTPELPAQLLKNASSTPPETLLQQRANRLLLDRYGPPGVVVNDDFEIVHTRGHTGRFLELPAGGATLNVVKLAREGLAYALRNALQAARKSQSTVRRTNLSVRHNGHSVTTNLEVIPIKDPGLSTHFLVLFEETAADADVKPVPTARRAAKGPKTRGDHTSELRIENLERDLQASRDHTQAMIQDLEAANEELQSANEEILSSNEELQSTNEELDTAREELQSTNEEINTVNEELHARNEELIRSNSDMSNLLASVQIAIVIVSSDLRIRRFTPMAERVLNLISTDVGRPIGHIQPNIDCPDLERRITEVVESVAPYECQVRDRQGNWYALRIRPYKNLDNRIDGAVLALFDINSSVRHANELEELRSLLDTMLQVIGQPAVILDRDLCVTRTSRSFTDFFRLAPGDALGESIFDLGNGQWDCPAMRHYLDGLQADRAEGLEIERDFPGLGMRHVEIKGRRLDGRLDDAVLYVLSFEVSERVH
jgi:two-component system, chemotaxis family, CheB/CheR fusion protein